MLGRAIATTDDLLSRMTPDQRQRYGPLMRAVTAQAKSSTKSALPATAVARVITVPKPRTRYTVGRDAALVRMAQFLPDRAVDRILAGALRPHYVESRTTTTSSPPAAR